MSLTDDHRELFSGGNPFILDAAGDSRGRVGAASPGTAAAHSACPPLSKASQVFPYLYLSSPGLSGSQRAEDWLLSPSISLPGSSPPSRSRLPSPGHWLQPPGHPSSAAGTRTRRHRDSPYPGHARKLCLTLQNAQPLGTKNRSSVRLDVFLSAGYTPSSRSIFSIGGTAWCRLNQRVVFHRPPEMITRAGLPRCRAAAGEYAMTGLLSDPAFLRCQAASTGKLLGGLPSREQFSCLKVAPGSHFFFFSFLFLSLKKNKKANKLARREYVSLTSLYDPWQKT